MISQQCSLETKHTSIASSHGANLLPATAASLLFKFGQFSVGSADRPTSCMRRCKICSLSWLTVVLLRSWWTCWLANCVQSCLRTISHYCYCDNVRIYKEEAAAVQVLSRHAPTSATVSFMCARSQPPLRLLCDVSVQKAPFRRTPFLIAKSARFIVRANEAPMDAACARTRPCSAESWGLFYTNAFCIFRLVLFSSFHEFYLSE